ncbi:predicted cell-wall-anchored protein SasA [Nonlabens ulvanivorans]|uniref:Predicted cell-wall-anchored protein SasA n=1 Tax=Nonlabens ulvanivorans TaxID=906888 RepID=A0A090Q5N0_NONUL|nr:predicted cell-wall-anchored protein SasA [Nonlabens ulvanivorans]
MGYYQFNEGAAGGTNTSVTTLPNIVASTDGTLTNFALSGTSSNWVAGPSMVTAILDDEVTESNGVLTAQQSGASYRWIRCSDGVVISGETAMTFTPTATGFYAGEITFNGCTQVSECVEVTTLGEESFQLNNLVLSQNPSQFLSFKGAIDQEAVISIYTISGKELLSASLNDSQTIQPTIANGLYMVTVSQNGASKTFKWIKE